MNLSQKQRAIRLLLDERNPADAVEVYYAYYHPDNRTQLITFPPEAPQATGYVALSRTGIDLFRPLMTLRLPENLESAAELIYMSLPPGSGVFISTPAEYRPLLTAFFDIQTARTLRVLQLKAAQFEPVINVLVARSTSPDGLPRFIVRSTNPEAEEEVGAWAGLNWQSPQFADMAVGTRPQYRQRGWGRSVVSALSHYLLESGRTPLYIVAEENEASYALAASLGFRDTGARRILLEATLRPRLA